MNATLQLQSAVSIPRRGAILRRDFLRLVSAGSVAAGAIAWPDLMALHADDLKRNGMACIVLWMQGGPSQFETLSPKPGHENGGDTKAIETAVPGIQISENLPHLAAAMKDVCIVRSMTGKEGSHPRATYLLHTGYLPTASVKYPTLGAHVAQQLGQLGSELPSFVQIGRGRGYSGGGFLGVEFDPFILTDPRRVPDNTTLTSDERRYQRRLGLLDKIEEGYAAAGGQQDVENHRKLYAKASRMVLSPRMETFDISREPAEMREAYGDSQFGAGCLLARRLVEAGVPFIEVGSGNWDTHFDNFSKSKDLCTEVDRPFAQLIADLKQRGRLEKTLIVWMGEFGRTPRINARDGRDHYPRAFSLALAGGGVRGGQVIGATDPGGIDVTDRPVQITDLFQTFCRSLQIDADHENMSGIGRPIKVVDGGEAVTEVF